MSAAPVRAALYARLAADATLTGLLSTTSSIYHRRAPANAREPFVIFHKQDGTPVWTFADHMKNELWVVKAVDRASSASNAETIAARLVVVLTDAALAIAGSAHLYLRPESDLDYGEDDGGESYQHVGALWRLVHDPA